MKLKDLSSSLVGKYAMISQLQYSVVINKKELEEELKDKKLLILHVDPNFFKKNTVEVLDEETYKIYFLSHKDLKLIEE